MFSLSLRLINFLFLTSNYITPQNGLLSPRIWPIVSPYVRVLIVRAYWLKNHNFLLSTLALITYEFRLSQTLSSNIYSCNGSLQIVRTLTARLHLLLVWQRTRSYLNVILLRNPCNLHSSSSRSVISDLRAVSPSNRSPNSRCYRWFCFRIAHLFLNIPQYPKYNDFTGAQ